MDFMPEDFRDSDELWLAENVFSHLKEFDSIDRKREDCVPMECNNEATILKEINDPVLNSISNNKDNQLQYDLQSLSRDGENKENLNEPETVLVENIKKEIPELKFSCEEFILPKEQTLLDKGSNNVAPENSELVVIQDEDSKQYYQVFMSLPDGLKSDDVVIVNEEDDSFVEQKISVVPRSPFIKCMDCSQVFEEISFSYHVCDYDWTQTLISLDIINNKEPVPVSSFLHPSNKKLKEKLILEQKLKLPVDPPCIRQIRENLGRIRKFIKDELKIDLTSSSEKKLDGPHECTLCERKFVHASGLSRHMEKHAMDLIPSTNPHLSANSHQLKVMIKCLVCGRLFFKTKHALAHFSDDHQTESDDEINNIVTENENDEDVNKEVSEDLINALIEEENQKNFNADIKEFKDKEYFDAIIVNDVLQCEFCEYIFSECSDLLLHSACHDPNRRFECCSCEIQVSTSKEIFLHWQAECVFARELVRENLNLKRYYTCNVCENKFLSMEQLFDHRYTALHFFPRLKLGTKILQVCCEYCGGVYDKIETLIKHREDKHLKKIIEKKNNSVALTGFGNVQNEIPTNQKLRQYLCDVCGKSYTQSSHLWQHLRFHRGVKPFSCKEPNCTRSFTIRPDLNDHIRKCHTGERPYQCQVCGKRFLTGSVYYQHRLIHRGDRRYACEECGKRFYRADALKNHLRIHTGEKPYGCLYCTKNFRQRGDRDKHIRARHSNLDENAKNVLTALKNGQMPPPPPPTKKNLFPSMPFISSTLAPEFGKKDESIVYVGNIPFASSIFNPILKDIDANTD